jgi:hypothetical protein
VTGKTAAEAEEILRDRGFEVETETRTRPDEDAGKVIGQSPSGEEAKRGSKVEITVGKAAPDEKKSASGDNPSDEPATDEDPSPGYSLIQDPSGGLTVEIPEAWTVLKGADSEYPGIEVKNWSSVAGEDLTSSITATPNLGDWHDLDPPVSGTYMVASRTLAQAYTDDELIYSTLYAGQAGNCEEGPTEPFQRSSLSGKMQTWHDCRGQGITNFIVVAYPDGRECVAVVQARLASEADRDAIEHLLDTFEVDCAKVSDA